MNKELKTFFGIVGTLIGIFCWIISLLPFISDRAQGINQPLGLHIEAFIKICLMCTCIVFYKVQWHVWKGEDNYEDKNARKCRKQESQDGTK